MKEYRYPIANKFLTQEIFANWKNKIAISNPNNVYDLVLVALNKI